MFDDLMNMFEHSSLFAYDKYSIMMYILCIFFDKTYRHGKVHFHTVEMHTTTNTSNAQTDTEHITLGKLWRCIVALSPNKITPAV